MPSTGVSFLEENEASDLESRISSGVPAGISAAKQQPAVNKTAAQQELAALAKFLKNIHRVHLLSVIDQARPALNDLCKKAVCLAGKRGPAKTPENGRSGSDDAPNPLKKLVRSSYGEKSPGKRSFSLFLSFTSPPHSRIIELTRKRTNIISPLCFIGYQSGRYAEALESK